MNAQPTLLDLREDVIQVRALHRTGHATIDQLYRAADAYIAALREWRTRTGRAFPVPSRGYLLRAL